MRHRKRTMRGGERRVDVGELYPSFVSPSGDSVGEKRSKSNVGPASDASELEQSALSLSPKVAVAKKEPEAVTRGPLEPSYPKHFSPAPRQDSPASTMTLETESAIQPQPDTCSGLSAKVLVHIDPSCYPARQETHTSRTLSELVAHDLKPNDFLLSFVAKANLQSTLEAAEQAQLHSIVERVDATTGCVLLLLSRTSVDSLKMRSLADFITRPQLTHSCFDPQTDNGKRFTVSQLLALQRIMGTNAIGELGGATKSRSCSKRKKLIKMTDIKRQIIDSDTTIRRESPNSRTSETTIIDDELRLEQTKLIDLAPATPPAEGTSPSPEPLDGEERALHPIEYRVLGFEPIEITEASISSNADWSQDGECGLRSRGDEGYESNLSPLEGKAKFEMLTKSQLDSLGSLVEIIRTGSYGEFSELLERETFKNDLLNVYVDGQTALHYTLIYGRGLDWCKQLVSNGANPNLTNRAGWHPIHLAAFNGSRETLRYFIDIFAK